MEPNSSHHLTSKHRQQPHPIRDLDRKSHQMTQAELKVLTAAVIYLLLSDC